jgi:uncharacterized protein (TIGR00156 family)
MKKRLSVLVFCFSAMFATAAVAQFTGPSASARPATVAEALDARLGSNVTLTGHIVSHQRDDYFTFRDDTGEIRVEIDRRTWGGREVTPEHRVRLAGEIERSVFRRYIDVERLEVL